MTHDNIKEDNSSDCSSDRSLEGKRFKLARQTYKESFKEGKAFNHKKRFLNWDPMKIMRGEEFDP